MNGGEKEDTSRQTMKRRGYDISEPHSDKRSRPRRKDNDDETGYYGPSRDDDNKEIAPRDRDYSSALIKGWECTECQNWNHLNEVQCLECGLYPQEPSSSSSVNDPDLDEFGRRRPPPVPAKPVWPPNFDTSASDYVLDNRSGMFYEAKSNFFYDPGTKLYYSHQKQAYFRHRLGKNGKSMFDEVKNEAADGETGTTGASNIAPDKKMLLPSISINLKTKALPKKAKKKDTRNSEESRSTASVAVASRKAKEHEADLTKWSERQIERKVESRDLTKIPRTAKGEPICSLCRRKFATLEKLFYHETASELHKSNLAKQKVPVEQPDKEKDEKPAYVDRAEQRRLLHGPDSTPAMAHHSTEEDPVPASAAPVDPKETLNEANIGNKMLQKLGWQQGKGLGRRTATAANELAQDWERIERLTSTNGAKRK